MREESQQRLQLEIAMLRSRLEGAEDMQRAIAGGELDGFVAGLSDEDRRVLLIDAAQLHYGEMVQRMDQGAITVSRTGDILYANQRFASMLGESLTRMFSASLHQYVADESRGGLDAFLTAGIPDSTLDVVLLKQDGHTRAARLAIASFGDGHASLLVTDNDGQAEPADNDGALQAIRNGEIDGFVVGGEEIMLLGDAYRPYEVMIDRMQQGAVTVSPEGVVLYANDRFLDMAGIPRDRLLGERVEACFVAGDHQALRDLLAQSRAGRGQAELYIRREDNSTLPVLATGAAAGVNGSVILMFTDLTEQRRHREIEEADRRKDEFLAILAHELRNPLAPIRNAVQILDRLPRLEPAVRDAVSIIERQSAILTRLLDDLLDIKRLSRGKITLRKQLVDLNDVVNSAVEAARPLLDERRHTLQIDLAAQQVPVHGDPVRLTQIVLNLLTNAAKYTPQGGNVRIDLRRDVTPEGKSRALLRVVDNGVGIPAPLLRKVFEPYAQLGESTDTASGLGLGLTVARQLLDLHGGAITARSAGVDQGSEFIVDLPIDSIAAKAPQLAVPTGRDVPVPPGLRILIADDNVDSAHTLALLLELSGHETRTANDGVEALRVADEFQPNIAFLDIGMPKLDGFGAARELRKRAWAGKLAIFALTGWGPSDDPYRAAESGFDAHLVKPIEAGGLDRLIASVREMRA
jgi:PAS domain S-box-containing protein